jgi:hypothetical protein
MHEQEPSGPIRTKKQIPPGTRGAYGVLGVPSPEPDSDILHLRIGVILGRLNPRGKRYICNSNLFSLYRGLRDGHRARRSAKDERPKRRKG